MPGSATLHPAGFVPAYEGQVPSLGWQVAGHVEHYLGIQLLREQAERLVRLYRVDEQGGRVIRRAALRRPKGAGKSPEGGYCGFAELTGPVVFDGWDANGQPVGRPRDPRRDDHTAWCQFAAVSEDQTDNVLVWLFEQLNAKEQAWAVDELGIDLGRTRIYLRDRPGRIEPVTAAAGSREGQPITYACLDQSESWSTSNGGVRLAAVLRRNVGKTDGWSYELQNAPEPGDGTVADRTARAWERGQVGVFFDTREPTTVPVLEDRPALLTALAEVYGESAERGFVNLERLAEECTDADTAPSDAYRYYLNVERPSEERAFDSQVWDGLAKDWTVPKGELIVLGFDGSRFDDATALVGTHVKTGHQFLVDAWEQPVTVEEGWEVPESEVDAAVALAFERWEVWRLYADPPYWETAVDRWAGMYSDKRVLRWWTNRNKPMCWSLRAYSTAMRARDLTHDGNELLARHIRNARRREYPQIRDERGRPMWTIRKPAPGSVLKIDAAMAACLSWEARRDALAAGATKTVKKRPGRVRGY